MKVFNCHHPEVQETHAALCCDCPHYQAKPRGPFATRDLAYYLCPVADTGVWQRNVEQLLRRWDLFTGRKVVCIATVHPVKCKVAGREVMRPLDSPDAVKQAFAGRGVEFVEVENDPRLREVKGFLPLFEPLVSSDPSRAIFFAHAKGVTYPDSRSVVHEWANVMYESLLDYWPLVEEVLSQYPLAGSFQRIGDMLQVPWHYSGTYYWLRSADLFSRQWRRIDQQWWGTESLPGRHYHLSEAGVVFHTSEGIHSDGDLYLEHVWRETVRPAWQAWKEAHQNRRVQSW